MQLGTALAIVASATFALAAPAEAPASDASLPRSGLAVQTSRGVQLVGLDGRLRHTLAGYRLRALGVDRLGQVGLRAADGRAYELRRHGPSLRGSPSICAVANERC